MIEVNEDRALWQRYVSGGDDEALIELFDRKQSILQKLAIQVTGNGADADDAIQAALAHLLEREPQAAVQSVQPWLIGVVLNQARSIVRREIRLRNRHQRSQESMEDTYQAPDQELEQQETYDVLNAALSELPENYREPLVLHYIEGMKFKDIADILGRKEETVKKQSQRAVKMMRKKMGQRGLSLTTLALIAMFEQLYAEENSYFTYAELGTAAVPLPLWAERVVVVSGSLVAATILCVLLLNQDAVPAQIQAGNSVDIVSVDPPPDIVPVAKQLEPLEKKKPWQQAKYNKVGTCPFGKLERYQATLEDLANEPKLVGDLILEDHYWRFKPKGKMPTMFETARLKLPAQYHMQFEFKIQDLERALPQQQVVYFGFLFNRSKRKINSEWLHKPDKEVAKALHAEKGKWHTVDIEVQRIGSEKSKLRDVIYSIDGEVYWRVKTNIATRDIIPIGVNNVSVIMRKFVYFDLDAVN